MCFAPKVESRVFDRRSGQVLQHQFKTSIVKNDRLLPQPFYGSQSPINSYCKQNDSFNKVAVNSGGFLQKRTPMNNVGLNLPEDAEEVTLSNIGALLGVLDNNNASHDLKKIKKSNTVLSQAPLQNFVRERNEQRVDPPQETKAQTRLLDTTSTPNGN
ncbi:hypothetical protein JG688_00010555 [Phytophthora aleatoria]|uniref:Uncharacterized protein n=1 Tax=Phytophthora aleatoria TaxID=2496075 RepID=A0A8J5IVZ1_9STRA|nr:hypothetical protein JG688_00010555 [Phytophthora aleatoria]